MPLFLCGVPDNTPDYGHLSSYGSFGSIFDCVLLFLLFILDDSDSHGPGWPLATASYSQD